MQILFVLNEYLWNEVSVEMGVARKQWKMAA